MTTAKISLIVGLVVLSLYLSIRDFKIGQACDDIGGVTVRRYNPFAEPLCVTVPKAGALELP